MRALVIIPLILLTGCDFVSDALKREPTGHEVRQAIARISRACGTPPGWLKPIGENGIAMTTGRDALFDDVDCVLRKVKDLPFKVGFAFVGNEAFSNEDK